MHPPRWYGGLMGIATLIALAAMIAAKAQTAPAAPAAPDLTNIDGTIKELYAVISRPTPGPRDWDRFLNLFDPQARIVMNRMQTPAPPSGQHISITPAQYKEYYAGVFERSGFFETELYRETTVFAEIAQVTSTYESIYGEAPAITKTRGVNFIQLYFKDGRLYILSLLYRPGDQYTPVPARLLPPR